jgi:hypothetical protein
MAKNFKELSEPQILALAISNEEIDGRIYADFAARLKDNYPATAEVFKEMEAEEDTHRRRLIDEFRRRFGEHIPLIRREDVKGFLAASRFGSSRLSESRQRATGLTNIFSIAPIFCLGVRDFST